MRSHHVGSSLDSSSMRCCHLHDVGLHAHLFEKHPALSAERRSIPRTPDLESIHSCLITFCCPDLWPEAMNFLDLQNVHKAMDLTPSILSILGYWAIVLGTLEVQVATKCVLPPSDPGTYNSAARNQTIPLQELLDSKVRCWSTRSTPAL